MQVVATNRVVMTKINSSRYRNLKVFIQVKVAYLSKRNFRCLHKLPMIYREILTRYIACVTTITPVTGSWSNICIHCKVSYQREFADLLTEPPVACKSYPIFLIELFIRHP